MLAHRLRRWPNIGPTFGGCLVCVVYNSDAVEYPVVIMYAI